MARANLLKFGYSELPLSVRNKNTANVRKNKKIVEIVQTVFCLRAMNCISQVLFVEYIRIYFCSKSFEPIYSTEDYTLKLQFYLKLALSKQYRVKHLFHLYLKSSCIFMHVW